MQVATHRSFIFKFNNLEYALCFRMATCVTYPKKKKKHVDLDIVLNN